MRRAASYAETKKILRYGHRATAECCFVNRVWWEETLARFEDTVQYAGGMDQLTAIGRKDLHAPHMRGSAPM